MATAVPVMSTSGPFTLKAAGALAHLDVVKLDASGDAILAGSGDDEEAVGQVDAQAGVAAGERFSVVPFSMPGVRHGRSGGAIAIGDPVILGANGEWVENATAGVGHWTALSAATGADETFRFVAAAGTPA